MEPASLAALKNYAAARQALSPDNAAKAPDKSTTETGGAESVAKAASEFAEVFNNAEETAKALSVGAADPHSVVEALATAEVALETAVTVRDKVIEAYQELLRMPV
ncbi:flagellar hook-basal body complex protein FliE [Parvularcula sp. IMCC14364]|uniref:flagellar hook-basal body complex protein FliE n=1 Tax=Parvularcula sp. IMCC14364 TaxID=3067902 RepID=UPI002741E623|nr:flagellar hook-basal body complex protein FliE [Parvularcula sp. IMCC14364]